MNTDRTHAPDLADALRTAVWHLSYLGHRTLDLVRFALAPQSRLRRVPVLRLAICLGLVAALLHEPTTVTVELGLPGTPTTTNTTAGTPTAADGKDVVAQTAHASFAGLFASAKTPLAEATVSDERALALIERFATVAAAEEERFGLDAGVLLAAAIVASPEATATNAFGPALDGPYESAWASWRAMSLSARARLGKRGLNGGVANRTQLTAAVASLYPAPDGIAERLRYTLRRYEL